MTLFKALRLLISNPLDVVEDGNCGDIPTEEGEASDNRIHSHSEPNALPLHAVKSAWEGIRPDYAQRTDYTHLKKVVVKKK